MLSVCIYTAIQPQITPGFHQTFATGTTSTPTFFYLLTYVFINFYDFTHENT